ncbi:MAG: FHA domain-containing protein [Chloroflexi bacterium]|nr:FHA domain-containing protein [Chloroflexota bacterium]
MTSRYRLVLKGGPATGRVVDLTGVVTFGRLENNIVALAGDTQVSRQHASIEQQGDYVVLTDLGSANGTYVNGHKIGGSVQVRPGDQIQIGSTVVAIEPIAAPPPPSAGQTPTLPGIPTALPSTPVGPPMPPPPGYGAPSPVGVPGQPQYAPPPPIRPVAARRSGSSKLPWILGGGAVGILGLCGICGAIIALAGRGGPAPIAGVGPAASPGAGTKPGAVVTQPSPSPAPIVTAPAVIGLAGTSPAPPAAGIPVANTGGTSPQPGAPTPGTRPSAPTPGAPSKPAATPVAPAKPAATPASVRPAPTPPSKPSPPPMPPVGAAPTPGAPAGSAPAGLTNFSSQRGGYQMRVPSTWQRQQDEDTDNFSEPDDRAAIIVEFGQPPQGIQSPRQIADALLSRFRQDLTDFRGGDVSDLQVDGKPASSFTYAYRTQNGTPIIVTTFVVLVPNQSFYLWRGITTVNDREEFVPTFLAAISSFKITGRRQ